MNELPAFIIEGGAVKYVAVYEPTLTDGYVVYEAESGKLIGFVRTTDGGAPFLPEVTDGERVFPDRAYRLPDAAVRAVITAVAIAEQEVS